MKKFPNNKIAEAYESAKGRVFIQSTEDLHFCDECGSKNYDHHALQWLYHQGVMERTFDSDRLIFEYRIVK